MMKRHRGFITIGNYRDFYEHELSKMIPDENWNKNKINKKNQTKQNQHYLRINGKKKE